VTRVELGNGATVAAVHMARILGADAASAA
jgi:hypothetical protein